MSNFLANLLFVLAILYVPVLLALVVQKIITVVNSRKKKKEDVDGAEIIDPSAIVVLVHGTFAPNAEWTTAGSKLRNTLDDLFGTHAIYYRYQWSGRNTFRARREAALSLSIALERFARAYPGIPIFVLAHSHGGNIALRALTPEIMSSIAGVVCLATPVLTARSRRYDRFTSAMFNCIGIVPSLLVAMSLEHLLGKTSVGFIFISLCGLSWWIVNILKKKTLKLDFLFQSL